MTPGRVLLTRTAPDGEDSTTRLAELGFEVVWHPALITQPVEIEEQQIPDHCHLIFTSRNGVRFAPKSCIVKADHVFCVGDATAGAAVEAGYTAALSANGNSSDIIRLIGEQDNLPSLPFIHMANDKPRGNIVESLNATGLDARLVQVYETRPSDKFAAQITAELSNKTTPCQAVLIYSPAAAGVIASQAHEAVRTFIAQNGVFAAISEAAAAPLADFADIRLNIAAMPTEDALFRALMTG